MGEPRTVRMIYFLPNDRTYRSDLVDSMKVRIRQVQTLFSEQMQGHGYGDKTFAFETDAQGGALVHRVDGQHPDSHYSNSVHRVWDELGQTYDLDANIYFIVRDTGPGGPAGIGGRRGKNGGYAVVHGTSIASPESWELVVHEMGHAFGLRHDDRNSAYFMSQTFVQWDRLSACAAEFLSVHPYFNPDIPIEQASPPTITVTSPLTYPPGSLSVPIRVEVGDTDGVHRVLLFYRPWQFHACRGLTGEANAVVEFDFRGSTYNRDGNSLIGEPTQPIRIMAVDTRGNTKYHSYTLMRTSPEQIGTLEGHTSRANSVSFSPDGTTLASGSSDATIKLWDVATRGQVLFLVEIIEASGFNQQQARLASLYRASSRSEARA